MSFIGTKFYEKIIGITNNHICENCSNVSQQKPIRKITWKTMIGFKIKKLKISYYLRCPICNVDSQIDKEALEDIMIKD